MTTKLLACPQTLSSWSECCSIRLSKQENSILPLSVKMNRNSLGIQYSTRSKRANLLPSCQCLKFGNKDRSKSHRRKLRLTRGTNMTTSESITFLTEKLQFLTPRRMKLLWKSNTLETIDSVCTPATRSWWWKMLKWSRVEKIKERQLLDPAESRQSWGISKTKSTICTALTMKALQWNM